MELRDDGHNFFEFGFRWRHVIVARWRQRLPKFPSDYLREFRVLEFKQHIQRDGHFRTRVYFYEDNFPVTFPMASPAFQARIVPRQTQTRRFIEEWESEVSDQCESAGKQVRQLLPLLRRRRAPLADSIEEIRELLESRREHLRLFDTYCARKFHCIAPDLRRYIVRLLETDSQVAVGKILKLSIRTIRRVAREEHAARNKRGRGREIAAEQREQILVAVRSGARAVDIKRQFRCSLSFIDKLRRQIGDRQDRRLAHYDLDGIRQALKDGLSLAEIVEKFGVPRARLWKIRRQSGDDEDRRRTKKLVLANSERIEAGITRVTRLWL